MMAVLQRLNAGSFFLNSPNGGQVFAESGAVMKAAGYLGGWWRRLAVLGSFCPSFVLNGVYKFIAKNRRRLSSKAAACLVPSPEQRKRFLA
jgi:predicted DCC family thiol-disulfide oxidoreductase YuxK